MGQVIKNLARTKRSIVVRRLNNFEGRQLLGGELSPDPISSVLTISPTQLNPITTTIVSTVVSTTNSDPTLINHSTSTALTDSLTPTPAPDYKIPFIVVVCISGLFMLTTAIVFIIRHQRKIRQVQMGGARSIIFGIRVPQPRPMIGRTPHEQQPSSSEKVDRSLPRPVAMKQHAQRNQQPVSILLPEGRQQSSGHVGHMQRQLAHAARAQDLPGHEEPPAYSSLPPPILMGRTNS